MSTSKELYGPEERDARISWDAYHMLTAMVIAERASCRKRLKVGAVIVKDKRQTSTGYNGAPPGEPTCLEEGCLILEATGTSCQRVNHAEFNAILQNPSACKGATIFVTHFPCLNCMRAIVTVGVVKVVYAIKREGKKYEERHRESENMAKRQGVELCKLSREDEIAIMELLRLKSKELEKGLKL